MIQIADVFAVSLSDEERYENAVSEHPAEKRASFVDNTVNKALVLNRDCVISASPLGENLNAAHGPNIIAGCRARLIAIYFTREPITVVDSTGTYTNILINSLVFSRTIKTGNALAFKINFKQLDVLENERSVIEVAIPRAQNKVIRGVKSSNKPDPAPASTADIDPLRTTTNYVAKPLIGRNFVSDKPNN